jgi:hypothetical protein
MKGKRCDTRRVCEDHRLCRKYAISLLNGKRDYAKYVIQRPRSRVYGSGLIPPLLTQVDLFDGKRSKRLRAAMGIELARLYKYSVLYLCYEQQALLPSHSSYSWVHFIRESTRQFAGAGVSLVRQRLVHADLRRAECRPQAVSP